MYGTILRASTGLFPQPTAHSPRHHQLVRVYSNLSTALLCLSIQSSSIQTLVAVPTLHYTTYIHTYTTTHATGTDPHKATQGAKLPDSHRRTDTCFVSTPSFLSFLLLAITYGTSRLPSAICHVLCRSGHVSSVPRYVHYALLPPSRELSGPVKVDGYVHVRVRHLHISHSSCPSMDGGPTSSRRAVGALKQNLRASVRFHPARPDPRLRTRRQLFLSLDTLTVYLKSLY